MRMCSMHELRWQGWWQVLHVGDRFTDSGNDSAVRDCCSILWVANPEETDFFIRMLLSDIEGLAAEHNQLKSTLPALSHAMQP